MRRRVLEIVLLVVVVGVLARWRFGSETLPPQPRARPAAPQESATPQEVAGTPAAIATQAPGREESPKARADKRKDPFANTGASAAKRKQKAPTIHAAKESVPGGFQIRAHYYPAGYSTWKPWETTINGDAAAKQEVLLFSEYAPPRFRLTSRQEQRLEEVVRQNDFFSLADDYSASVTDDSPTQELRITTGGRVHTVQVYAAERCEERDQVIRFEKIWAEVLTLVPSPNKSDGDLPSIWLNLRSGGG